MVWFKRIFANWQENTKLKFVFKKNMSSNISTNTITFLGIYIDNPWSWEYHIDYLCKRLFRVVYLLQKINEAVPKNYTRVTYFAYFQSIIRYGLILLGNCTRYDEILRLQKNPSRAIIGPKVIYHCQSLLIQKNILTLPNLYIFDLVIYIMNNPNLLRLHYDNHKLQH